MIEFDRLYHDLMEYWTHMAQGFVINAMIDVQKAWENQDFETLVEWAVQEGFNINDYYINS